MRMEKDLIRCDDCGLGPSVFLAPPELVGKILGRVPEEDLQKAQRIVLVCANCHVITEYEKQTN